MECFCAVGVLPPPMARSLDATAKTQLSSIFEKTGTHRQAELVRLLLDATEAKEVESGNNERFPPRRRSG